MVDFVVTLFVVLIEPVVEGVAVTGFLFFLTLTQYYQQSGDTTQEVSSRDLKIEHNRPFPSIYLIDSYIKKVLQFPTSSINEKKQLCFLP